MARIILEFPSKHELEDFVGILDLPNWVHVNVDLDNHMFNTDCWIDGNCAIHPRPDWVEITNEV